MRLLRRHLPRAAGIDPVDSGLRARRPLQAIWQILQGLEAGVLTLRVDEHDALASASGEEQCAHFSTDRPFSEFHEELHERILAHPPLSPYTGVMAKSSKKPKLSQARNGKAKKINLGGKPSLSGPAGRGQSPVQDQSQPRFDDTDKAQQLLDSHGKPSQGLADLVSEFLSEPLNKFEQGADLGNPDSPTQAL